MPLVNFRKKFCFFSFDFRENFDVRTFPRWLSIRDQIFFDELSKNFFSKIFTFVLLDKFPDGFSKFRLFIVKICILMWYYWVFFENYSMRMLSIRGTDFIAHWEYEERISAHAQPAVKCEQILHVQSMLSSEHTRNEFYRTLCIRGTNFIECWAYLEPISSHAEHARKCLKVEYIGRIEYDFQKYRVTGSWDHMVSVSAKKVKKIHACVPLKPLKKGVGSGSVSQMCRSGSAPKCNGSPTLTVT